MTAKNSEVTEAKIDVTADTRQLQFWAIGVRVRAGGRVYDPQDPISVTPTWGVGRRVNVHKTLGGAGATVDVSLILP